MKKGTGVWIFSEAGSWFVGVGRGYYNYPLAKADAIRRARQLAIARRGAKRTPLRIQIFGEDGEFVEQVV